MDWQFVIKPLLSNRIGALNKNETVNVIKTIIKCENEFFDEDSNYAQFYTAFAVLAADKLSQCKLVCQTQLPQINEACSILIRFMLDRLRKVTVYEMKWLLPALKSLCDGKSQAQPKSGNGSNTAATQSAGQHNTGSGGGATVTPSNTLQFDYNVVAAVLKSSKLPETNKGIVGGSSEKESPKSEVKRSRSDLSSIILQQLTAPLEAGKITWTPLSEELTDCSDIFSSANIACMETLNGADTILDVCTVLPILARYRVRYQETITALGSKPLYLPLTPPEATQIKGTFTHMVTEISIIWQALSLPILQPLSPGRIVKLSKCAISALYCAVLTSIATSVLSMSSSTSGQKSQQPSGACGGGGGGPFTGGTGNNAQSSKEADEAEEQARFIVDKGLEIYTRIGEMFKISARSHIYQNHLCFGAWLLVSGIQGALGASGSSNAAAAASTTSGNKTTTTTDETNSSAGIPKTASKSSTNVAQGTATGSTNAAAPATGTTTTAGTPQRSLDAAASSSSAPSARVNLFKVQQGFGVLNAAIANHCIKLLSELIDDLKIETTCNDETQENLSAAANFDILEQYTSLQRLVRVLNTATLHQLFTFLGTVSYRKACALRRAANAKDRTECDPISYSDSTTYFNDTLSCSDNSEDDSESYLGHWFKETLSPEATGDDGGTGAGGGGGSGSANQAGNGGGADGAQKYQLVAANDEPHEYLELAAQLFCFMDAFFANRHDYLHRYVKSGLSDQQMLLLANILKDLDRDASRGEIDLAASSCPKWQAAMIRFSGAVGRYLHNLISASLLSETLQSSLLQYLSVSPWSTESNAWPLQVYASTLSVLVQIMLLKPIHEKEAACLTVWHRLINTLVEGVCATSATSTASDADYEDLNMEHAQLLLFLFHSLNLMQKKSILLLTAGGVIRCSEVCRSFNSERPVRNSQIMLLSRLLLLLEYLMKHLYNAPPELLDQVRWNLFSVSTMHDHQKVADLINGKAKLISFCCKDIEEPFRKIASADFLSNIRPTFYSLTMNHYTEPSVSQEFKLDGLAWNFILCTPDKLKYPLLVDALIDILTVTDMSGAAAAAATGSAHAATAGGTQVAARSMLGSTTKHTLCAMQYCFGICWKLLLGLPPSTQHVEALLQSERPPTLHSLVWSIRCPLATSHYLIVNSLVKQGMYTQCAETLWGNVAERVSDVRFSLRQTLRGVEVFIASSSGWERQQPRLSEIILFDALVAHMQALAWAEGNGLKPERAATSAAATTTTTTTAASTATTTTATTSPSTASTPPAGSSGGGASSTDSSISGSGSGIGAAVVGADQTTRTESEDGVGELATSANATLSMSTTAAHERLQLVKDLLLRLIDAFHIVAACVQTKMTQQLLDKMPAISTGTSGGGRTTTTTTAAGQTQVNNSGTGIGGGGSGGVNIASSTPSLDVLNLIIPIASSKNLITVGLNAAFLASLPTQLKHIIDMEWPRCLLVSRSVFNGTPFNHPGEEYTLTVIESHISELTNGISLDGGGGGTAAAASPYTLLNSMKHTLRTILSLIDLLLQAHGVRGTAERSEDTAGGGALIDDKLEQRLQMLLVATILDTRMEYIHELSEKCMQSLMMTIESGGGCGGGGGADVASAGTQQADNNTQTYDARKMIKHQYLIKHCHRLLLTFAEELRDVPSTQTPYYHQQQQHQQQQQQTAETVAAASPLLFAVLRTLTGMLDTPLGKRAVRAFYVGSAAGGGHPGGGSLVELLLSFTGTRAPIAYAQRLLQFVERLFQLSEQPDAVFERDELVACFDELTTVDGGRLRAWLTHIIYGPSGGMTATGAGATSSSDYVDGEVEVDADGDLDGCGISETADKALCSAQPSSSTPSSNAQTPTNMATVSAMPSITDQLAQSSAALDAEAMEIDEDEAGGGGGGASSSAAAAGGAGAGAINEGHAAGGGTTTTTATTTSSHAQAQSHALNMWQTSSTAANGGGGGGASYHTNQSDESTQDDSGAGVLGGGAAAGGAAQSPANERNGALLLSVVKHIVCGGGGGGGGGSSTTTTTTAQNIALTLFQALLQLGQTLLAAPQETADFVDILQVMITLADTVTQARGHATLFGAAITWLEQSKCQVLDRASTVSGSSAKNMSALMPPVTMENITALLRYLGELLQSLGYRGSKCVSPPWDDDMQTDLEELMDEMRGGGGGGAAGGVGGVSGGVGGEEDGDSFVDDSDEDSLNNKLCTFSQTQKEFMNQHWYHCHTCNMVNTVGVCSICARVCHRGHDVSYAKYGNFFCDCGAKEDGSCQALSRRLAAAAAAATTGAGSAMAINVGGGGMPAVADSRLQNDYNQCLVAAAAAAAAASTSGGATTTTGGKKRLATTAAASSGGATNRCPGGEQQQQQPQPQQQQPLSERISFLSRMLDGQRDTLQSTDQWAVIVRGILEFFDVLLPLIRENCALYSIVGCHERAKHALDRLHHTSPMGGGGSAEQPAQQQSFQMSDQLMVPTLGSQEGAFENVRMSYSGDQGQTIKQLLSSGLVRRVALCCLSSPHGKRQHLAVSHEKGKVTILQLSALLKQADAAKRKLTLTQLSSAPIPCTVLSLTANAANEDCLAVCGLKECHILTFTASGTTNDHIVLTPQLENGNFIKKALWLPGSQTMLALVTADYVKIYELAEDAYSPKYYFLVAVGKIRDCTFVCQDGGGQYSMLIIASSGYIYYQKLDDQSLAKHGDFYVTNTLDLQHPHIKDVNGQLGNGGVSIYYSHMLQLLFFSYSSGKSFMAPLIDDGTSVAVRSVTQLQTSPPGTKNSSKGPPLPLCQWTEIAGHPGLVCAMMHTLNNPVIFMLTPERIVMQEIKAQSSKARIMDMVAIRHTVAGVEKTTLILLCEDGSLRIFTAQAENTSYWLSPQVQPQGNQLYTAHPYGRNNSALGALWAGIGGGGGSGGNAGGGGKRTKRLKGGHTAGAGGASVQKTIGANGSPIFPIDFFEHCALLHEVQFGGNDLLQIYNKQKLKTRLFSTGMFVASTKPSGFTLEVYNGDQNSVIVGIRVLLGTQDPLRAPQSVTVLGRTVPTMVRRARWFDIPLTRDEILQSDKCLKVVFGRSQDPENVSMLDCIEVYGKSKDVVGWPDDGDEAAATGGSAGAGAIAVAGNGGNGGSGTGGPQSSPPAAVYFGEGFHSITNLDRMVSNLLEVLDCSLQLLGSSAATAAIKQKATRTATALLLLPTPQQVQVQSRYVLATLFGNRLQYHAYKDGEVLAYVNAELQALRSKLDSKETLRDIDPEAFYRLVLLVRGIATARPQSLARICAEQHYEIIADLMEFTQCLYAITPQLDEPTSIVRRGLCHPETVVHCLVEVMHAFALADAAQVERMTKYFIELMKHSSSVISHSAKEAIILLLSPRAKRRNKAAIVTPPTCTTPTPSSSAAAVAAASAAAMTSSDAVVVASTSANAAAMLREEMRPSLASASGGEAVARVPRQNSGEFGVDVDGLEPLMHDAGGGAHGLEVFFPQLLGLQRDAGDDEAIMDIAIALSLQQHDDEGTGDGALESALQQGLANLRHAAAAGVDIGAHMHNLQQLEGVGVGGGGGGGNVVAVAQAAASVSAGGSDDDGEGSNVATDGSTLRTSPAEPAGSGGSESGGSGVESFGGTSGRSSTYGDQTNASPPRSAGPVHAPLDLPLVASDKTTAEMTASGAGGGSDEPTPTSSAVVSMLPAQDGENAQPEDSEDENLAKLHDLRLSILEKVIANVQTFNDCNGLQSIPLIQVILMLTTDLNGNNERDEKILNDLLTALVEYVEMDSIANASKMKEHSAQNEVRLVVLCLFGVLMGKTKSKQAGTTSPPHQFKDNASFVAGKTAGILSNNGAFTFSLVVMESLLQHWKRISNEQNVNGGSSSSGGVGTGTAASALATTSGTPGGGGISNAMTGTSAAGLTPGANNLLKATRYGPKPDISTIIPHNYLKSYPDVFESYDALLTEVSVRLPYQILRLSSPHPGTYDWYHNYCENMTYTLCEYMMLNLNALLRRQVRKLLMYICGNKEKFRMFRDGHSLDVHFNFVKELCGLGNTKNMVLSNQHVPMLTYDSLVELTEHLRTCQEISQIRTGNWQKFCIIHEDVIPVLLEIACFQLDDGVSPIILQLLQAALCNNIQAAVTKQQLPGASGSVGGSGSGGGGARQRSDRDKSEEMELTFDSKFDPAHCSTFVHQIFRFVSDTLLNKFVRIFLLETNITAIRWQAHSLLYAIYENANDRQREKLIGVLWNMWPLVPVFGRRTAQFVDILGYLTLHTKSIVDKLPEYTERAVEVLRQQNELLARHPNAPIYTTLEQILQVNGFYLESEPCLVCNNPEVPMSNIKLPSIKSDSKFTTTTMIVKLVQSHTISKLIVRIADLKRSKMVRTINIYYNNRTVQAVVELKNRPAMWHRARSVTLQSGQTDVKVDFPLPITACNLMVEYADFYETVSGSSENLQCPRCSAAVPAYPGVCANCGENVFQCHKCRAINYDEKDPFLCHSCGFCKYAKFDFSIYGRVCCAVDPIESAEDRAKTVQIIHSSLERADRIYRQLQTNKQMLELLIQKVAEHRCSSDRLVDDSLGTLHSTSQVNKIIQLLAQKYCVESRTSFEELSKIVQRVKACRSELVAYDRSQMDQPTVPAIAVAPAGASTTLTTTAGGNVADTRENYAINRCYGCALASTEQCLTLLRAMASNYDCRIGLYGQGLVEELAQHNLRRGTPQIQDEVRSLLVLLTKGNKEACMSLLQLIAERVKTALLGAIPQANLDSAIHHEMILLEFLIAQDDFCWESKLKIVFELFLITCRAPRGPAIAVIQPCLRIMQALICPTIPTSKLNRDLTPSELSTILSVDGLTVDFNKWLQGEPQHSFDAWKARMPVNTTAAMKAAIRGKAPLPTAANNGTTTTTAFGGIPDDRILAAVLQSVVQQSVVVTGEATTTPPIADSIATDSSSSISSESEAQRQRRALAREAYLTEKYGRRWRNYVLTKNRLNMPLVLSANWLQPILFNTNSRFGRQLACSLITSLSRTHERKREILNLLTGFLRHVGEAGEASAEFLALYRTLAADTPWRQYLALKGVLGEISLLMTAEIVKIHRLEETTLSSDLSLGYALRQFVELLALFLESAPIRQAYKTRLLGAVLEGYLSLRKLVVQRTRLIDDAQEKLLEMLEEMTSGTEEETRAFMEILIDTVERKTRLNDIKTPVFIFERLYSIIHPEESDESEFFMTLEKDPQQEDFLQGRMLGNPYPSSEVGLGPLMRDVKNKICTDCELIALLEDDNGMELLVNNKIISLDLPVKEVYKKVWLAEGGERDAMRIVYRMRGLLGDATEEFVETLNAKSQEEVDNEQLYRMANVLAECNGLKVMLDRIGSLKSISRTRELLQVLLKLFLICVKVRRCQEVLCQPELGAINTLLKVLQICLQSEPPDSIQSSVTEQLLEIMETILSKAASDTLDSFLQFSLTFGGPEYVSALISCTECSNVRNNPSVLRHLIRVLAALVYGNEVKMALLCEHFKEILNFDRFDAERTPEEEFKMELFCVLTNQIEHNCIGGTLKDYIVGLGFVERAIAYVMQHAPCVKPTLLRTDSDELKEFISRPSLKYILRFLTGLATKHEATQVAISQDIIPIIHRLEQVSSDEHVGSLAENLLEALCTDTATASRVQEVRDFTRAEKKRLAMATREKQLDALGMHTNEKGQVTAKGSILQKIEKLRDETGLTCFICREGYACQSTKVLGIYTFTKRCNVEDFELKSRKTVGYTTVTHFNVVHVDCHISAIRLTRGRDEWERASLQNANTRCNGLLPLWGPDVSEPAFTAFMVRHSSYMQESTQRCDISFPNSVHDLKLLLMRFAWERSFHDDAGGGGPQSNMHFVPYLLFYAVYLLLSSRSAARDSKALMTYLTAAPSEKWLECGYEVEGPHYMVTLSLALHSHEVWNKHKLAHLKRLLAVAQARYVSPSVQCKALLGAADRQAKEYSVYRPYLMMWSLVDLAYNTLFKSVSTPKEEDWSVSLFDYIRRNDEAMLKSTDAILQTFTDEFLPCTSFGEFCDVAGLLHLIENPDGFIDEFLATLPTTVSNASGSN